jgi:uncharacterized protein YdeI (BOF family)
MEGNTMVLSIRAFCLGRGGACIAAGCLSLVFCLAPAGQARAYRHARVPAAAEPQDYPTGISLNEFMPDPNSDWNDDGTISDSSDEYIEVYNDGSTGDVDLSGWKLDDVAGGGSTEYVFPQGTILRAARYFVVFSADTRIALNNSGDTVRLVRPDGSEADTVSYMTTAPDQAYSRTVDGIGPWTTAYPPSPGAMNQPPPTATPTETESATPTPSFTASPTSTLTSTPSETATAVPTVTPTAGATPTPTPFPGEISLNEYMPDPLTDWNGNGQASDADDEYVELYNGDVHPADLSGWVLDDVAGSGSPPFVLPPGASIPPAGFLLLFSAQTHLSLNNGGDTVRLVRPDGLEVETASYTASRGDQAQSKTTDGGSEWTTGYPPSPGVSNQPQPTATPTPTAVPVTASVSGHVFLDADGDGQFEPWLGENGLANVLLMLSDGRTWMTGPSGWYGFRNLAPGSYVVRQAQPLHTSSTTADEYAVMLAAGDDRSDLHFGENLLPPGQYDVPVVLNEFLPSPASDWDGDGAATAEDEWIELYNSSDAWVDLSGWFLDDVDDSRSTVASPDGSAPYVLPAGSGIAPHSYIVVFRSTSGVALNNSGDTVRLLGPALAELETNSFGSTGSDISWSKVVDGSQEWTDAYPPSLGSANQPPSTPTPTATAVVTVTITPTALSTPVTYPDGISLNEYLPDPASDWDGDGAPTVEDEYVELYNANAFEVDLSGWMLDDVDDGAAWMPEGSRPYVFPPGTTISARGFRVLFRSRSGVALNNDGDWVRLVRPDGVVVEETQYQTSDDDEATSKALDGGGQWTLAYPPSPGRSNLASTPTVTPTATWSVTPTPTEGVTVTGTPTTTPSDTPDPASIVLVLNEFMPDPASDWNQDGTANQNDEYIEVFNAGPAPVDLGGWMLDDMDDSVRQKRGVFTPNGSPPYVIPAGAMIEAGGFVVFFRDQTGVALNNDGDWIRLVRPDGVAIEAFEYASSRDDQAYSKTLDGGSEWTRAYAPSPGRSNTPGGTPTPSPTATPRISPSPTATPTVTPSPGVTGTERIKLNEVLSSPKTVDWDGDGTPSYLDEWVELVNLDGETIHLAGWSLVEGPDASTGRRYTFPAGWSLEPGQYLVVYRRQSHLALDAGEETVSLLFPNDALADRVHYASFAGYDQSWCRLPDGTGDWSLDCIETPGSANLQDPIPIDGGGGDDVPMPPYDRFNHGLVSIAQARSLPDDARVTLEGQVTVLPNVFDDKQLYIQDASGGILVYLRSGEWPPLSEGQWVRVNGRLDTLYGEKEIRLTRIDDIKTLQPAAPPPPRVIRTGDVGEPTEGTLIQLIAPAVGFRGRSVVLLDDGSGEAVIVFRQSTGMRRPYVEIGEPWTVVGIAGQDDDEAPFDTGYRVLPRRSADVMPGVGRALSTVATADDFTWNAAPIFLPVTGAPGSVRSFTSAWIRQLRPVPGD